MSVIGGLSFIGSIIWGLIVLFTKIFGGIGVQGWTTLMIIILFSSGLTMLTLGVLGEYIWRTMDAARNRPAFIIDEQRTSDDFKNI
jgi:dolichol-phosphate mannosyltransferase